MAVKFSVLENVAGVLGLALVVFGVALWQLHPDGYSVAQYFGWQWGKYVRPRDAARFHLVVLVCLLVAAGTVLTTIDPITVTEYSLVFSAVALPLTYLPILVIANDPDYMGARVNGRVANLLGMVFLVIILVASLAAIPLTLATRAGQ